MNKLNVGDYVRTKKGYIRKIIPSFSNEDMVFVETHTWFKKEDIFKQVDLEADIGGCERCPKNDENETCIGCLNNAKDKLLNYITDLQEENQKLKDYCNFYEDLNSKNYEIAHVFKDERDKYKDKYMKLVNVISGLEKELKTCFDYDEGVFSKDYLDCVEDTLYKLNELKGGNE